MASLAQVIPGGFNAAAVEPQAPRSSEPLPPGAYDVEITNAEVRELKSGNGTGLNIEYTVVGPEQHARRKLWQNLNIAHTNPQAEQIGQSQLSALCRAVGIGLLNDSDELFQKMLRVQVKVRPAQGSYGPSNDISGYEAIGTPLPAVAPTQAARPAANTAAAKSSPPWKK
jgi:hypothetical protein